MMKRLLTVICLVFLFSTANAQSMEVGEIDTIEGDFLYETWAVQAFYFMPGDYIIREPIHVSISPNGCTPSYISGVYVSFREANQVLLRNPNNEGSYGFEFIDENFRKYKRIKSDPKYLKAIRNLDINPNVANCNSGYPFVKCHMKMVVVYVGENYVDVPNLMMSSHEKTIVSKVPFYIILNTLRWD